MEVDDPTEILVNEAIQAHTKAIAIKLASTIPGDTRSADITIDLQTSLSDILESLGSKLAIPVSKLRLLIGNKVITDYYWTAIRSIPNIGGLTLTQYFYAGGISSNTRFPYKKRMEPMFLNALPDATNKVDVIIGYTLENYSAAVTIAYYLDISRVHCWLEMRADPEFTKLNKLKRAFLRRATIYAPIITPEYLRNPECRNELEKAANYSCVLVPILLDIVGTSWQEIPDEYPPLDVGIGALLNTDASKLLAATADNIASSTEFAAIKTRLRKVIRKYQRSCDELLQRDQAKIAASTAERKALANSFRTPVNAAPDAVPMRPSTRSHVNVADFDVEPVQGTYEPWNPSPTNSAAQLKTQVGAYIPKKPSGKISKPSGSRSRTGQLLGRQRMSNNGRL